MYKHIFIHQSEQYKMWYKVPLGWNMCNVRSSTQPTATGVELYLAEIGTRTDDHHALYHHIDPYPAEVIYLNFQPLEVVSRYRDPQPQVVENYSYLFSLRPNINKYWYLNSHFITNNSDLIGKWNRLAL